jgi:hypothetical protein
MASASRITLSPHEWTWTGAEQIEMARGVCQLSSELHVARGEIADLRAKADTEAYAFRQLLRKRDEARGALEKCQAENARLRATLHPVDYGCDLELQRIYAEPPADSPGGKKE